jgi:methionyl-tRNA formyltransferase
VLRAIEEGTARATEQDHARATHAAKIEKEEGRVTFAEPRDVIYNRFRAFDPWPGIYFETSAETVKILDMRRVDGPAAKPGTIVGIDSAVTIAAAGGLLRLDTLQRPGKPRAAAGDVARGLGWRAGEPLP